MTNTNYAKNVYAYDDMKRKEHMAVRKTCGWYLWTHHLIEVKGPDAASFLDYMIPNNISNLKVGSERYTTILNDKGTMIDDVVVLRIEEDMFWVSTLFAHHIIPWFEAHKAGYDKVAFTDISRGWHMYAVQGPRSLELVNSMVDNPVDELKFFTIRDNSIDGVPVKVNRAGFTGEKVGYEIYLASDKADFIEEKFKEKALAVEGKEVTDFQVMAWTLPTEAGFLYMRDLRDVNPLEVGLDKGINYEKDFVGKAALMKIRDEGPTRIMLGYICDETDVRFHAKDLGGPGDPVMLNGEEVGRLSKFNYSYLKEKVVGYILVDKEAVKVGDHVQIKGIDVLVTERMFF